MPRVGSGGGGPALSQPIRYTRMACWAWAVRGPTRQPRTKVTRSPIVQRGMVVSPTGPRNVSSRRGVSVSVDGWAEGVNHDMRGRTSAAMTRSASFPTSVKDVGSSSVLVNQGWTVPFSGRRSRRRQRPSGFSRHIAVGSSRCTPTDAMGGGRTSCPRHGRPSPVASKQRA